ncbi:MAG: hypothetical protein SGI73_14085 [Chloroflexota bacterium]|nr:hypothetical protein [Chloroflexota bacterium]
MDSKAVASAAASHDVEVARRLWDVSAQLAGIEANVLVGAR